MPLGRGPSWAALPHDLVQQAAGLLSDDADRAALAHVCSGWHAALAAAPHLWPTTVLSAPPVDVAALSEYGCEETRTAATRKRRSAHVSELRASQTLLDTAARLSPLTQRVRLKGWMQQPLAVPHMLLALPAGLQVIELNSTCAGPVLATAKRFEQLQELRIAGSAADIDWHCSDAAGVLRKLVQLHLDFRQVPDWDLWHDVQGGEVLALPPSIPRALVPAASRLHSLALRLRWDGNVPALSTGLPALEILRLDLYSCSHADATSAVSMLEQLPRLRGIKLGIHAYMGTGMGSGYTGVFPSVHLPAMLGVQALTELELAGEACLPPDWRQLSSLQRLRLLCRPCGYGGYLQLLTWGEAPLTALTALTCLELDRRVLPEAALVATAPRLSEIVVLRTGSCSESPAGWRARLATLRPDVAVTWG